MTTAHDKLTAEIYLEVDKPIKKIDELIKRVEKLGHLSAKKMLPKDIISKNMKDIKGQFAGLEKQIDQTFSSGEKKAAMFDMRMLSLLFGGMALKRAFGGMLKSIVNTYVEAEDHTSGLSHATTRLSASWKFLQFSIMDALNADWFIAVIDQLVSLINWVSQLDKKWKITGLVIIGLLAVIGTAMMVIGQIGLGWHSIFGVGGFLNKSKIITSGFGALTKLLAAGLIIKTGWDLAKFFSGEATLMETLDNMGDSMMLWGAVSKNPWMIAIGIIFKLLPFGGKIKSYAKGLLGVTPENELASGMGVDRMQNAEAKLEGTLTIADRARSILEWIQGIAEVIAGTLLGGLGSALTIIGDKVDAYDAKNKLLEETIIKKVNPAIDGTTTKIDNLTSETIPNQVSAIDNQMIPANEREAESWNAKATAVKNYFDALRKLASESDIDELTNLAAPTGESK